MQQGAVTSGGRLERLKYDLLQTLINAMIAKCTGVYAGDKQRFTEVIMKIRMRIVLKIEQNIVLLEDIHIITDV